MPSCSLLLAPAPVLLQGRRRLCGCAGDGQRRRFPQLRVFRQAHAALVERLDKRLDAPVVLFPLAVPRRGVDATLPQPLGCRGGEEKGRHRNQSGVRRVCGGQGGSLSHSMLHGRQSTEQEQRKKLEQEKHSGAGLRKGDAVTTTRRIENTVAVACAGGGALSAAAVLLTQKEADAAGANDAAGRRHLLLQEPLSRAVR